MRCSLQKERRKQTSLIALNKKSEVSESLLSLFLKEQNEQMAYFNFSSARAICSFEKSDSLFFVAKQANSQNWKHAEMVRVGGTSKFL